MKISGTHAFVNQVFVGLLVTLGFGGTIGLGTVWMRHQISVVADANRALQQKISDVERQIADANTLVEQELSPDVLRRENETMHLGLEDMKESQVVVVTENPVYRLAARANARALERREGSYGRVNVQFHFDPAAPVEANTAVPARSMTTVVPVPSAPQSQLPGALKLQLAISP